MINLSYLSIEMQEYFYNKLPFEYILCYSMHLQHLQFLKYYMIEKNLFTFLVYAIFR